MMKGREGRGRGMKGEQGGGGGGGWGARGGVEGGGGRRREKVWEDGRERGDERGVLVAKENTKEMKKEKEYFKK